MAYTPNTWATGDTITAAKLNHMEDGISEAGSYDAVILLTHADNSALDTYDQITPSIVSGTFAACASKILNGEPPKILIKYRHELFTTYMWESSITVIDYYASTYFVIVIYGPFRNGSSRIESFSDRLQWTSSDTIAWY